MQNIFIQSHFFASHDLIELFLRHQPILICIGSRDHVLNLVLRNVLVQLLANPPQCLHRHKPSLLIVEQCKHFPEGFPRVLGGNLASHQVEEILEADGASTIGLHVADELVDGLVLDFKAFALHGLLDF